MPDIVNEIRTGDEAFDTALIYLRQYHLCQHWGRSQIALYVFQRPIGIRSREQWSLYLDALLTIVTIGVRKGWIVQQRERHGRVGYFLLDGKLEQARVDRGIIDYEHH